MIAFVNRRLSGVKGSYAFTCKFARRDLTHWRRGANAEAMEDTTSGMTFEDALKALEEVVRRLESGEVPLDESITLYEKGEALRRHCQARLDAAGARIEKIVAGAGGQAVATAPFDSTGA